MPVVLCSGYSEVVQLDEIYDYGAKAGLAKPFRLNDLADVLARAGRAVGTRSPLPILQGILCELS